MPKNKIIAKSKNSKRKRFFLTLEMKSKILERINAGENSTSIGREFGLGESTIRGVRKNADRILNSIRLSSEMSAKNPKRIRNPALVKTEKRLGTWTKEKNQAGDSLTGSAIRNKALELYEVLSKGEANSNEPFTASKGWLSVEKFGKRSQVKVIQLPQFIGESLEKSASNSLQTSDKSPFDQINLTENQSEEEVTDDGFETKPNLPSILNTYTCLEDDTITEVSEKNTEVNETDHEERDLFGKYIAAALKRLPEEYSISATSEIQNIITKYKLKSCTKT